MDPNIIEPLLKLDAYQILAQYLDYFKSYRRINVILKIRWVTLYIAYGMAIKLIFSFNF